MAVLTTTAPVDAPTTSTALDFLANIANEQRKTLATKSTMRADGHSP